MLIFKKAIYGHENDLAHVVGYALIAIPLVLNARLEYGRQLETGSDVD